MSIGRRGNRAQTRVPPVGSLRTAQVPPSSQARSRMLDRPRPRPPATSPAGKPPPESRTASTRQSASRRSSTSTREAPACFRALVSASCRILNAAVSTAAGSWASPRFSAKPTSQPASWATWSRLRRAAAARPPSSMAAGRRASNTRRVSVMACASRSMPTVSSRAACSRAAGQRSAHVSRCCLALTMIWATPSCRSYARRRRSSS